MKSRLTLVLSSQSKSIIRHLAGLFAAGVATLVLTGSARAADLPGYEPTDPSMPPPQACVKPAPSSIDIHRSLVVHDQATLATGFEFSKTIGAILASANLPSDAAAKETFVKTLLDSLMVIEQTNPRSGLRMKIDVRTAESNMLPAALLDPANAQGLIPIGLFNRLDLAPKTLSDCGEHRIVYSFKKPLNPPFGRFLVIFEAKLPNPDVKNKAPGQKVDPKACVDVAKFWTGLTAINGAGQRNAKLQEFYYQGLPGVTGPVVNATNYGDPLGQVRGNQFVDDPWMLREWRVQVSTATSNMEFKIDTVKSNPLKELYGDNDPGSLDPALQAAVRQQFQSELLSKYVKEIVEVDQIAGVNATAVINGFGISSDIRKFDEFQSESQDRTDVPEPSAGLKSQIGAALPVATVSADEAVNRLNVITCQGCHQTANGSIGKINGVTVNWPGPPPFTFVHIQEPVAGNSALSAALNTELLPFRRSLLSEAHCPDPARQLPLPPIDIAGMMENLESTLQSVRGSEALPGAEAIQGIENAREAIRQQSEEEPGFFVDTRRPH